MRPCVSRPALSPGSLVHSFLSFRVRTFVSCLYHKHHTELSSRAAEGSRFCSCRDTGDSPVTVWHSRPHPRLRRPGRLVRGRPSVARQSCGTAAPRPLKKKLNHGCPTLRRFLAKGGIGVLVPIRDPRTVHPRGSLMDSTTSPRIPWEYRWGGLQDGQVPLLHPLGVPSSFSDFPLYTVGIQ